MTFMIEQLNQLDQTLFLAINGMHTDFSDLFMWCFSSKLIWIPFYATIVYVLFRNYSWKVAVATLLAVGLTILMADQICSSLIRPAVERFRPSNLKSPIVDLVHIVHNYRGGAYGFPSCHATNTFALATFLWMLFRNRTVTIGLFAWALLTVWSRVALGVHYPGDLLVGGLIGMLSAFFWVFVLKRAVGRLQLCSEPLPQDSRLKQGWTISAMALILTIGMLIYALCLTL